MCARGHTPVARVRARGSTWSQTGALSVWRRRSATGEPAYHDDHPTTIVVEKDATCRETRAWRAEGGGGGSSCSRARAFVPAFTYAIIVPPRQLSVIYWHIFDLKQTPTFERNASIRPLAWCGAVHEDGPRVSLARRARAFVRDSAAHPTHACICRRDSTGVRCMLSVKAETRPGPERAEGSPRARSSAQHTRATSSAAPPTPRSACARR